MQTACPTDTLLATICPYLFEQAISPARAIRQSQQPISIQDLENACETPNHHFKLVEGAGGIYSPLALDGLNIDLASALNLPIILVVGNKLGCLNQALLSIAAIQTHGLSCLAVVLNDLSPDADLENLTDLRALTSLPVYHLPYQSN